MRYLLSLSVLVLFSCSSMKKQAKTNPNAHTALSGTSWTIGSIPGFELEKTQKPVTISFADTGNRFSGDNGCNSYGGLYTLDGGKLTMEKILSTKKACMPGMQTEHKVMGVFNSADHYRVSGDVLTFLQGDKVLAVFNRSKKAEK